MKRQEIEERIREIVENYISDYANLRGRDMQLCVNPGAGDITVESAVNRLTDMYDSQAALEAAAASEGDRDEAATDFQVEVNPVFYPLRKFVREEPGDKLAIDTDAIRAFIDLYLG